MGIVAITRPKVKPARTIAGRPNPFGAGIRATRPVRRVPLIAADADSAATTSNTGDMRRDEVRQAMADEATFLDRYTRGCVL
jgi:hypothetical protein